MSMVWMPEFKNKSQVLTNCKYQLGNKTENWGAMFKSSCRLQAPRTWIQNDMPAQYNQSGNRM